LGVIIATLSLASAASAQLIGAGDLVLANTPLSNPKTVALRLEPSTGVAEALADDSRLATRRVTVDEVGNLYVLSSSQAPVGAKVVLKVDLASGTSSWIEPPGADVISDITYASGRMFMADSQLGDDRILSYDVATGQIQTFASGFEVFQPGGRDFLSAGVTLSELAVDGGLLFVSDHSRDVIYSMSLATGALVDAFPLKVVPATGNVEGDLPCGQRSTLPIAVAESRALVRCRDEIYEIDIPSDAHSLWADLSGYGPGGGVEFALDASAVYAPSVTDDVVLVLHPTTGAIQDTLDPDAQIEAPLSLDDIEVARANVGGETVPVASLTGQIALALAIVAGAWATQRRHAAH
jgi:hypothetical protein